MLDLNIEREPDELTEHQQRKPFNWQKAQVIAEVRNHFLAPPAKTRFATRADFIGHGLTSVGGKPEEAELWHRADARQKLILAPPRLLDLA